MDIIWCQNKILFHVFMYVFCISLSNNKQIQITEDVVVVLRLLSSFTNLIGKKEKRHPLWLICDLHNG